MTLTLPKLIGDVVDTVNLVAKVVIIADIVYLVAKHGAKILFHICIICLHLKSRQLARYICLLEKFLTRHQYKEGPKDEGVFSDIWITVVFIHLFFISALLISLEEKSMILYFAVIKESFIAAYALIIYRKSLKLFGRLLNCLWLEVREAKHLNGLETERDLS